MLYVNNYTGTARHLAREGDASAGVEAVWHIDFDDGDSADVGVTCMTDGEYEEEDVTNVYKNITKWRQDQEKSDLAAEMAYQQRKKKRSPPVKWTPPWKCPKTKAFGCRDNHCTSFPSCRDTTHPDMNILSQNERIASGVQPNRGTVTTVSAIYHNCLFRAFAQQHPMGTSTSTDLRTLVLQYVQNNQHQHVCHVGNIRETYAQYIFSDTTTDYTG